MMHPSRPATWRVWHLSSPPRASVLRRLGVSLQWLFRQLPPATVISSALSRQPMASSRKVVDRTSFFIVLRLYELRSGLVRNELCWRYSFSLTLAAKSCSLIVSSILVMEILFAS